MSQRDPQLLLQDMLDHARKAQRAVQGRVRNDLENDEIFRAACERFVEIIGEAASRLPPDIRKLHPEIQWKAIAGTRNVLAHAYMQVDLDILWDIIERDIPAPIKLLERAVGR